MLARSIKALKAMVVAVAEMDTFLRCALCVPILMILAFIVMHPIVGLILLGLVSGICFLGIVFIPWLGEKCKEDVRSEDV